MTAFLYLGQNCRCANRIPDIYSRGNLIVEGAKQLRTFFNVADLSLPVMVEHVGAEWQQGVIIRYQGFPHFHWLQSQTGTGAFWVRDKRYELAPGMGILIAPGVPHRYEPIGNEPWQVRFATFQGSLVDDLQKQMVNSEFVLIEASDAQVYERLHETLLTRLGHEPADDLAISAAAYQLLLCLTRHQKQTIDQHQPDFQQYVGPAIAYMQEHLAEDISISQLAAMLSVSTQYLNRVFNRLVQQTPSEYLTQIRISHAKKLLVSQKYLKINVVAEQSGYADPAYFGKVFKKQTGVSPLNYRHWQT